MIIVDAGRAEGQELHDILSRLFNRVFSRNVLDGINISIAAVIQEEAVSREFVPVVMSTHLAREGDLLAAIEKVDRLDVARARTKIIRILQANT